MTSDFSCSCKAETGVNICCLRTWLLHQRDNMPSLKHTHTNTHTTQTQVAPLVASLQRLMATHGPHMCVLLVHKHRSDAVDAAWMQCLEGAGLAAVLVPKVWRREQKTLLCVDALCVWQPLS